MDARTEYISIQDLLNAPNLVLENQTETVSTSTHNATALCEAAFEHLPIAPILLKIEPKTGNMYCTDVRLAELKSIMAGNAQFSKPFIYNYLKDKRFSELLRSIQRRIEEYKLCVVKIKDTTPEEDNLINYQYTYLTKDTEGKL